MSKKLCKNDLEVTIATQKPSTLPLMNNRIQFQTCIKKEKGTNASIDGWMTVKNYMSNKL